MLRHHSGPVTLVTLCSLSCLTRAYAQQPDMKPVPEIQALIDQANAPGNIANADVFWDSARRKARKVRDSVGEMESGLGLGNAYVRIGQFDKALAVFKQTSAEARSKGDSRR